MIDNTDALLPGGASLPSQQPQAAGLGKDDFVKLLVTQLSNQDPLDPTDPTEFVTQLAQFTSLEQLVNIEAGMQLLTLSQSAATNAQMLGFIGREVAFEDTRVSLDEGHEGASLTYRLDGAATKVTVAMRDATGKTVRTIELSDIASGEHDFQWDGLDERGVKVPAGTYEVAVTAEDAEGNPVDVDIESRGRVDAVRFSKGYPELVLDGGRVVTLGQVLEIVDEPDEVEATGTSEETDNE